MTWYGGPPEEPAASSGGDAADAGAPAQPRPDVMPRQMRPGETPPPPPSATSGRGRAAGDSASRKLPADVFAGVPCATCPPRHSADGREYDGALVGAGCRAFSGRAHAADVAYHEAVIASARHFPSDANSGLGRPRAPGGPAAGAAPSRSRAGTAPRRNVPSPAEIRDAFAHPVQPEGPCCAKHLAAAQQAGRPPRTIVYVNGIRNDLAAHCCSLRKLASTTCARVVGVFNATEGATADVEQARGDIAVARAAAAGQDTNNDEGRNPALDAVRALVVAKEREGEPLEIWAHSQGGASTSGALFRAEQDLRTRYGEPRPLENVTVNSFGSAAVVWPDGPTYTHYIHEADPVAAHLTGGRLGDFGQWSGLGTAGLGLGPFGERVAGRGATVVYADGPVPAAEQDASSYAITERVLPDPTWRRPMVPSEEVPLIKYHSFDGSYLPLYRQRAAARGRGDGCSPPTYPYGDPCGPAKPPQVARSAPAAAREAQGRASSVGA